jgi:prepilin peptidase CpaA
MPQSHFFSDPVFGWVFYAVLVGLTVVAAYTDLRTSLVPKWVTLTMLGLGVLFNIARQALLAATFTSASPWLGAAYGLLFSLAGFGVGFGLFFLLWILGVCGGGDVKLFAALGAWVGPLYVLFLMVASAVVLVVLIVLRLMTGGLSPLAIQARRESVARQGKTGRGQKRPKFRMTYSLPVAIGTAVVLLYFFRAELRLTVPGAPTNTRSQAHAK